MDNQLFTGGPFLDDMPQVCTLCGLVFNNSLAHQHHMQLHMLANAQLMGSQPPPDPGFLDSDIAALPTKAYTYVSEAALPKPYGSAQTSTAPGPAIDMAVNPLGTGYFNALTQKLINPSFSINNDFSKPGSSGGGSGAHGQKGKIYFENGALINNEYDKISDSNDDDDLDRILDLDTIDAKTDKIDSSKDFEIEELLNEFNEKQEDMKNNSGHLDDFLKDVIGEPSKAKAEAKPSKTEESFMPPEAIEFNQSAIAELLDAEMEKIDMETKEVEKSRLSAISSSGPSSSTTSDSVDDTTSSFPTLTTTATSTTPTSVVSTVSAASGSDAKPPDSEPKKDEDHVDFDIPKVGKLMKIRKYVEIQKQKEQTAVKQVAVKVHEKKEPPVEEKPQLQTIIVQVSKRKKIEYGPYINKQSLLEGKPKNMPAEASPPKPFRPKPKPQTPVRRTFNLRERRNKPDFATLAGTHPRNSDGKKSEEKSKDKTEKVDKDEKDIDSKDIVEVMEIVNETVEGEIDTANELSGKILTRNKEKEKMKDKSSDEKKKLVKVEDKSADIAKNNENETVVDNGKPKLRSRHVKTETENVETKNLRKRNIKVSPDSGIKHKVKKTDPDDAPEKETRSKGKQKGDKTEIKKCSVNLGEKLNTSEAKSKGKLDKSRVIKGRTENTILEQGKEETPKEVSVDIETNKDIDIETVDGKPDEDYKEIADESNTTAKQTELEEVVEEDNDNADDVNMKEKIKK
ncbi:hypothetical protein MAR_005831 [Mya arenaria]|uniref:C2H2-type domain-containing protein n=1 Tax=Mya arenaria TaxID=6604 RepID=A0ABY7F4J4_MYAAR|nr:hypothetical protein MAR_005831 [Mya arenaria]